MLWQRILKLVVVLVVLLLSAISSEMVRQMLDVRVEGAPCTLILYHAWTLLCGAALAAAVWWNP